MFKIGDKLSINFKSEIEIEEIYPGSNDNGHSYTVKINGQKLLFGEKFLLLMLENNSSEIEKEGVEKIGKRNRKKEDIS